MPHNITVTLANGETHTYRNDLCHHGPALRRAGLHLRDTIHATTVRERADDVAFVEGRLDQRMLPLTLQLVRSMR